VENSSIFLVITISNALTTPNSFSMANYKTCST
jgi:hypothetical protein